MVNARDRNGEMDGLGRAYARLVKLGRARRARLEAEQADAGSGGILADNPPPAHSGTRDGREPDPRSGEILLR